jgi:hypothetical protein
MHDESLYMPDIRQKFLSCYEKIDELSNRANDELGSRSWVTFELELIYIRMFDMLDDIESIMAKHYE